MHGVSGACCAVNNKAHWTIDWTPSTNPPPMTLLLNTAKGAKWTDYEGKSHSPSLSDMGATLASLCRSDVFITWPPIDTVQTILQHGRTLPFSFSTNGVDGWIAQFPSNPQELTEHVCWEYNGVRETCGPTGRPELQKSLVFLSVCESSLPSLHCLPLTGLSVAFN